MKKMAAVLSVVAVSCAARDATVPTNSTAHRFPQWCYVTPGPANPNNKPVVLLVGDSITWQYKDLVATQLAACAVCKTLATSACIAEPAFREQLEKVITGNRFAVIHFNNGLHDFDYSTDEYRAGYEQMLKLIRKEQPGAKLILALSTPLKPGKAKKEEVAIVNARNEATKQLALQFNAPIDDLYAISKDHPEYYKDTYHFLDVAKQLQADQVAKMIVNALKNGEPGAGGGGTLAPQR